MNKNVSLVFNDAQTLVLISTLSLSLLSLFLTYNLARTHTQIGEHMHAYSACNKNIVNICAHTSGTIRHIKFVSLNFIINILFICERSKLVIDASV